MKNNRGITLITLTVAVLIMIILSSMLIYNAKNGIKIKNLKDMQNDIEILEDKVNAYYVKYAEVPAEIEYLGNINFEPQPNDDDKYCVLDLKALEGISLNYGSEFTQIKSEEDTYKYNDIYIINKQSMHIYYAKGIEIDGVAYYTNSEDESVTSYRGTYVIGQKGYAETLEKAIEIAENGDTIKLLKDVEERTPVEITKNITIDTNGKTMTFNKSQRIINIDQNANVSIIGNGIVKTEENTVLIFVANQCSLTAENVTIHSNSPGGLNSTIISNGGNLFFNNAIIDSIETSNEGSISIKGGEYDNIYSGFSQPTVIVENANISKISVVTGKLSILSGTVNLVYFNEGLMPIMIIR